MPSIRLTQEQLQVILSAVVRAVTERPVEAPSPDDDPASRLFVSYARKDSEQVEDVYTSLSSLTFESPLTLFKADRHLVPGTDWQQTLWSVLRASDIVVACLSRHFLASPWCQEELRRATAQRCLVIPCLLEPCDIGDVVRGRQLAVGSRPLSEVWGDAHRRAEWLRDLTRDVRRALRATADPDTPSPDSFVVQQNL